MVKRFNLGERLLCFGLRHYWDKKEKDPSYWPSEFKNLHLGITLSRGKGILLDSKGYRLDSYYLGINFLYLKVWVYFTIYSKRKNGN